MIMVFFGSEVWDVEPEARSPPEFAGVIWLAAGMPEFPALTVKAGEWLSILRRRIWAKIIPLPKSDSPATLHQKFDATPQIPVTPDPKLLLHVTVSVRSSGKLIMKDLPDFDLDWSYWDSDYATYFKTKYGCSRVSSRDDSDCRMNDGGSGSSDGECDVGGDGENGEEDEEGQMDIHLKMFLESIEADGVSYVLKRDGRPDLRFEGMDEDGDLVELSSNCGSEERGRGEGLDVRGGGGRGKGVLKGDDVGNSGNGKTERGGKEKKYRPVEKVDLTQVKRRGKKVDKQPIFDENESDTSAEEVDVRLEGTRASRKVEEIGKLKRKAKNVEEQKSFVENKRYRQNVNGNGKSKRRAENVEDVEREMDFMENERDSSALGNVKRCLSEKFKGKYVEPDYRRFFELCELEGADRLVLVAANGKRVVYGKDDSTSLSDSEVYVLDHAPDCIESTYAPTLNFNAHMEDGDLQCLGSCNPAENPLFRKAVIDILRKPFNNKELERLQYDVKQRKRITRHVDMRSGNTSFQQPKKGKSYLDHYAGTVNMGFI
ncbi:hypothetical protein DCAR_0416567 [Daucus carota subsp. sativus]|uniref:Uncharacterized protein n=1 Tax=Daucus carota subsp. sativus TaxID=79200 RepID=A0A165XL39_DAUCS|nr:hypothetical protein DCAR_0416567 [Daucus carota subsp. sativus]